MKKVPSVASVVKVHPYSVEVGIEYKHYTRYKVQAGREPNKKEISAFTRQSVKRLRLALEYAIGDMVAFLTLTYPKAYPTNGRAIKAHLKTFLHRLQRRGVLHYLWVEEFQTRGAPHFHVLVDKAIDRKELSKMWFEIVKSGDEKHLKSGTSIEEIRDKSKMSLYMCGYLSKNAQKAVPDGFEKAGRFWGTNVKTSPLFVATDVFESKEQARAHQEPLRNAWNEKKQQYGEENGKAYRETKNSGFTMWGMADKALEIIDDKIPF